MTTRELAKVLGQRGGLARGRRLAAADRRRIAVLGGRARMLSLQAARRIAENFRYVTAMDALQVRPAGVKREHAVTRKLPGLYASGSRRG